MGIVDDKLDELKDKSEELKIDPETKAKIEIIAKERSLSVEDAMAYFFGRQHDDKIRAS